MLFSRHHQSRRTLGLACIFLVWDRPDNQLQEDNKAKRQRCNGKSTISSSLSNSNVWLRTCGKSNGQRWHVQQVAYVYCIKSYWTFICAQAFPHLFKPFRIYIQADKIFLGDAEGWVYVMSRSFKVARQKCYNNICSHMHLVRTRLFFFLLERL